MGNFAVDGPLTIRIEGTPQDVARLVQFLDFFCRLLSLSSAQSSRIDPDGTCWVAWSIGTSAAPRVSMRRRRRYDS